MNTNYGVGQRLLELAAIAAFAVMVTWGLCKMASATGAWFPAVVLAAIPAGWAASDLLSGVAHWAFDSFGNVRTPVLGRSFIRPFREHHVDPDGMTRHDFVETHGSSCLAALPLLAVAAAVRVESPAEIAAQSLLVFTALGALATNQCHKWAHMEEAATPIAVRWAQRHRLVLSREHHRLHHTPPFDTHFCMSSGWFNAAFNSVLRAWR